MIYISSLPSLFFVSVHIPKNGELQKLRTETKNKEGGEDI